MRVASMKNWKRVMVASVSIAFAFTAVVCMIPAPANVGEPTTLLGKMRPQQIAERLLEEKEWEPNCQPGDMACTLKFRRSLAVVIMVSILVFFSVCMETFVLEPMKVLAEESENLEPIVSTLFSELTLLGFVGLFMFIVDNLDLLTATSIHFFQSGEAMGEMFEIVHMVLFLVMIIFLLSATLLLYYGSQTAAHWRRMNKICLNSDLCDEKCREYALAVVQGKMTDSLEGEMQFISLRHRFVKTYNLSPHGTTITKDEAEDSHHKVPHDFEMDDYLAIIQGETTGELIEIPVQTWVVLEILLVALYFVRLVTSDVQFAAVFVALAYVFMYFQWRLSRHLENLIEDLTPYHMYKKVDLIIEALAKDDIVVGSTNAAAITPQDVRDIVGRSQESKMVEAGGKAVIDVPDDHPALHPPYLKKTMISKAMWGWRSSLWGRLPNRHEAMFVGGRMGKSLMQFLMRMQLMWSAIYLAVLLVSNLPAVLAVFKGNLVMQAVAVVVTMLPIAFNFHEIKDVLHDYVLATSVEMMRENHTIHEVRRRMTTKKAIRCLKLIKLLKRKKPSAETEVDENGEIIERPRRTAREVYTDPVVLEEKRIELKSLFDLFDRSHDGNIGKDEMSELLQMMNVASTEDEVTAILADLDDDNSGEVSFPEFFNWMADNDTSSGDESVEELVEGIFAMIDKDNDGSIDAEEFKDTMKKLGTDLSMEDIEAMIHEVDDDGDGELDKEEFTRMIEKYQDEC